jgi:hypothetical protein
VPDAEDDRRHRDVPRAIGQSAQDSIIAPLFDADHDRGQRLPFPGLQRKDFGSSMPGTGDAERTNRAVTPEMGSKKFFAN